jgi:hypothetical protein
VNLSVDDVARLWKSGELEQFEEMLAPRPRMGTTPELDEFEPLPPLDRDLLARMHGHGLDVLDAVRSNLRAYGTEEPRRVYRFFDLSLTVR